MKWKCTYQPEEESAAAADLAVLLQRHPGAKVKRSDKHPPYRHIYVTIPESDCLKCDNAFHLGIMISKAQEYRPRGHSGRLTRVSVQAHGKAAL